MNNTPKVKRIMFRDGLYHIVIEFYLMNGDSRSVYQELSYRINQDGSAGEAILYESAFNKDTVDSIKLFDRMDKVTRSLVND